jgi:hypothetical protein
MVSRELTIERKLLQYMKVFNITVYIDNILGYYHSLSVDVIVQLSEKTSLIKSESKITRLGDSSISSSIRLKGRRIYCTDNSCFIYIFPFLPVVQMRV